MINPKQFLEVGRDKDGRFTHVGRDLDMGSTLKQAVAMNMVNQLKKTLGLNGQGAVAFLTDDGAGGIEVILPAINGVVAQKYDLLDLVLGLAGDDGSLTQPPTYELGWYQNERGELFQFTSRGWKPHISDEVAAALEKLG